MVKPPTLKAAKPVGAATTTFTPPSVHTLPSEHFKASIRNDLPVPPTPLTHMESGLISEAFTNFVTFLMLKVCVHVLIRHLKAHLHGSD